MGGGFSQFDNSFNESGGRPCVRANDSRSRWCDARHHVTRSAGVSERLCV